MVNYPIIIMIMQGEIFIEEKMETMIEVITHPQCY